MQHQQTKNVTSQLLSHPQSWVARCYRTGISLIGLFAILTFLLGMSPMVRGVLMLTGGAGLILVMAGFALESSQVVRVLWKKAWVKWLVGISAACVWSLSTLLARHQVNAITHLSPEYFTTSTTWLAAIAAPFVFSAALYMMSWALIPLAARKSADFTHATGRFLGGVSAILAVTAVSIAYAAYSNEISSIQKSIIAIIDHYPASNCSNIRQPARFAKTVDGYVSVATYQNNDWQFEEQECLRTKGE